jgi:hypothetical protein
MTLTRSKLLASAEALCKDFAGKASLPDLLSHFSTSHQISALEHGEPYLAPFLGRKFEGRSGSASVEAYFTLLQKYLTYEDMSFGETRIVRHIRKASV